MLQDVSSKGHMLREGEGAVVRQGRSIAVVGTFLIGCAFLLLMVGCAGTSSESPKEQGPTEATEEQAHSERCEGTRTIDILSQSARATAQTSATAQASAAASLYTTNDLPGCPKGGLLSGTDKLDKLAGGEGDDELRGLGGRDKLNGGNGNDVVYGGPGGDGLFDGVETEGDDVFYGGAGNDGLTTGLGEDVLYGGDGDDFFSADRDRQRDKLYCGKGKDSYLADKNDYVDSSCEKKRPPNYFYA